MYRFKLQALLNHRHHQEEICQKEMAEAQRNLSDAQAELRRIKKDTHDNLQILHARQKERHNVSKVIIFINYIKKLSNDLEAQMQRVAKASEEVNQKRHDLITIMKKRKTLEKLKANSRLEFEHKMLEAERKFNDEVSASRHIRKM